MKKLRGTALYCGIGTDIDTMEKHLKEASEAGINAMFTSLQLPEADVAQTLRDFPKMAEIAHRYGILVDADIATRTATRFGIDMFDVSAIKELGIDIARYDGGCTTEKLVELAVKLMPQGSRFIDLCTGSGCVAISTLAARGDCMAVAVDLFEQTLEVARENAERNGVGDRLGFIASDVLKPEFMDELGKFDCILSNPPYIETEKIGFLDEELSFEPEAALDGGDDGLDFYRAIIGSYGRYLTDGGIMLLEIGCDQAKAVTAISHANGFKCEVYKDFGGNDRVAYLTKALG